MKKFLVFTILLLVIGYALRVTPTFSATLDELQAQISAKNKQISDIETEINKLQNQINQNSAKASTLKNEINQLNLQKKKLQKDISLTQKKIETTKLNIQETALEITQKESDIQNKLLTITETIKNINDNDQVSVAEIILTQQNFSDFFSDTENMQSFQNQLNSELSDLKELKISLEEKKQTQQKQKTNLEQYKSKLTDQNKLVQTTQTSKNKLLTETKNEQSNYQKLLEEKIKLRDALEKEVFDYESQLKYQLDPKSIPAAGSGVLKWPLAKVYITQKFGLTLSSKYLYESGLHNGVDFRASIGTEIYAAADGVVDGVGNTDTTCPGASFGKWILIKYDNGLATTYGHLSLIKVTRGDKVEKGQMVGYGGNTGYSTGPHLHVSVYPKDAVNVETRPSKSCSGKTYTMPIAPINAYLDPLLYF
jgi:murein DD-endopeptidase MepM/ murein hydrolase activator NlpD